MYKYSTIEFATKKLANDRVNLMKENLLNYEIKKTLNNKFVISYNTK